MTHVLQSDIVFGPLKSRILSGGVYPPSWWRLFATSKSKVAFGGIYRLENAEFGAPREKEITKTSKTLESGTGRFVWKTKLNDGFSPLDTQVAVSINRAITTSSNSF